MVRVAIPANVARAAFLRPVRNFHHLVWLTISPGGQDCLIIRAHSFPRLAPGTLRQLARGSLTEEKAGGTRCTRPLSRPASP